MPPSGTKTPPSSGSKTEPRSGTKAGLSSGTKAGRSSGTKAGRSGPPAKAPARRRLPAVLVKKSAIHGRGLFAAEPIPRGTLIGVYEGPRTRREGAYVLWIEAEGGTYGVAGKNSLRFVNHSTRPNAYFDDEELWSSKAIRAGEEITFHYGADWE